MINSVHSPFDSSLPLSSDGEVSPAQLNVKLAASHDSGCVSPRGEFLIKMYCLGRNVEFTY